MKHGNFIAEKLKSFVEEWKSVVEEDSSIAKDWNNHYRIMEWCFLRMQKYMVFENGNSIGDELNTISEK